MDKVLIGEFSVELGDTFSFANEDGKSIIKGIEIFKTGKYRGKTYTKDDIDKMVENFTELKQVADFDPPARIGHRGEGSVTDMMSVCGYVLNLYRTGNKLLADVEITEPEAYEKIKRGTFKKRSAEIGSYETNDGEVYSMVLWGFGFVDIPQVEGMSEVKVYGKEEVDYEVLAKELIEEFNKPEAKFDKAQDARIDKILEGIKGVCAIKLDEMNLDDASDLIYTMRTLIRIKNGESIYEFKKEGDTMEEVKLSKEDHEKLVADAAKVEELSKRNEELEELQKKADMDARLAKVDEFTKEGKIIAENEAEKEFVQTLTKEQFEAYTNLKTNQPALVKLDNENGKADDEEPSTEATTQEDKDKESVELAKKLTEPYQVKE
jgi:hypothetical protein